MKVSELISEVRTMLADTSQPYLWSNAELLAMLRDTLLDVNNFVGMDLYIDEPVLNDDITFDDTVLLKYGIVYRAYLKQDTDIFDGKAVQLLKQEYIDRLVRFKNNYIIRTDTPVVSNVHSGLL